MPRRKSRGGKHTSIRTTMNNPMRIRGKGRGKKRG